MYIVVESIITSRVHREWFGVRDSEENEWAYIFSGERDNVYVILDIECIIIL